MKHWMNESSKGSINELNSESFIQSMNQSIDISINKSIRSNNQLMNLWKNELIKKINELINEIDIQNLLIILWTKLLKKYSMNLLND